MKPKTLIVAMAGRVAGELHRPTAQTMRFEYDDDYRRDPTATPLSVAMPLTVRKHANAVVAPWLRGLLPDDDDVLTRWARHFGVRGRAVFDLLAAPIGEDCAGAVQFCTPARLDDVVTRTGSIEWLDEAAVAARIRTLRKDTGAWLGPEFTGQWSLAGNQAKTALRNESGRWGDPRGAEPTTHILKPAITGLDDHDLNEHLCLRAAHEAGLATAPSSIARFEDQSVIVIERYDRYRSDEQTVLRVHQEDVCQALGKFPADKYEAQDGPSAKQIVELLRAVMPPAAAVESVWRFVDALIWNWIIVGTDAHAKNYSLLLSGNDVRLAPLYDVASALPYDFYIPKLHLAMKVDNEYQLGVIAARHWQRLAGALALDGDEVLEHIRRLVAVAPDAFSQAACHSELDDLDSPLPGRLIDAVAERAAHCRRTVS